MPSPITPRHETFRAICSALGLSHVRSLTLRAEVGEAVTVEVERFLTDDEAGKVLRIITEHDLVAGDGREMFMPEELVSGDDVTTVEDDSRKYKS